MKYRKKPVEIEAMQLTADNACEVLTFCNESGDIVASKEADGTISIKTLEGTMTASIGDYVIKGVKGEFYLCKPDIFEATYDKVEVSEEEAEAEDIQLSIGNIRIVVSQATLQTIIDELECDPWVVEVGYETNPIQIKFVVEYPEGKVPDGTKEASFTIYEGTAIVRENGIYRTEHKNG